MSCPVQTFVGASCAPSVSSSFSSLSSSSKSSKSSLSSPPLKLLSLSLRMSSLSDQGHHRFHIISNHWLWSPPLYLEVDNPQQLKFLTICSFSFLSFAPYFHVDINSGWSSSWSAVKVKSFHEIPLQAQNYNPAPPGWMKLITPTSTLKLNSRCCQHHIYPFWMSLGWPSISSSSKWRLHFPYIQNHEDCDLSYQETDEIFGGFFSAKPHHDRDSPSIKTTTITELDVDVNYSISHSPPHLDRDIPNLQKGMLLVVKHGLK